MIDQINELPEDGLKSSPETLCFTENKWISRKNQNKFYFFLHLMVNAGLLQFTIIYFKQIYQLVLEIFVFLPSTDEIFKDF